ncbi:MAG: trypsin-like peptidase domain-containing protein [Lachnospiraceae bacterium]|nr:trypsin-like peptidase domain-containing protein [Lachnospiraceae bacterium]
MKKIAKLVAGAAIFGMIAGTTFQGVSLIGNNLFRTESSIMENEKDTAAKLSTTNIVSGSTDAGTGSVSDIAERVLPSIVAIDVTETVTQNTPFGMQSGESTGSASGILIAEREDKLYIATNNHVVEGADSVTIKFCDESTAKAQVKGTDSSTDLAVVMVDMKDLSETTKKNIKIATVGDSTQTKVGERAIAIGNALGYGTSVTVGYISAKDREIDSEDSSSVKLIQTDAAINPGNSGGALVNSNGAVIGINSSKFASEEIEGMGFAIPMATAEPILNELMNQEPVAEDERAYLGIVGKDVSREVAEAYGLVEGIYISEVSERSPAEEAGLRTGYIITGINGKEVKTLSQLSEKLSQCRAGDKGTITVKTGQGSGSGEKTLEVTFGKKE